MSNPGDDMFDTALDMAMAISDRADRVVTECPFCGAPNMGLRELKKHLGTCLAYRLIEEQEG